MVQLSFIGWRGHIPAYAAPNQRAVVAFVGQVEVQLVQFRHEENQRANQR